MDAKENTEQKYVSKEDNETEDPGVDESDIDVTTHAASARILKILFPGESLINIFDDVVFCKITGTITLTNFRMVFFPSDQSNIVEIPNLALWKIKTGSKGKLSKKDTLYLRTKDFRKFNFQFLNDKNSKLRLAYNELHKLAYPDTVNSVFAFSYYKHLNPSENFQNPSDMLTEYERLGLTSNGLRITEANLEFKLCTTYPRHLSVPATLTDAQLEASARFRSRGRLPVCIWRHPLNNATISRCSQPCFGMWGSASEDDARLLAALRNVSQEYLHVLDSRPITNARANSLRGGGYEKPGSYKECHPVVFQNIENIHIVRKSLSKFVKICSEEVEGEQTTSDLSFNEKIHSLIDETKWLEHLKCIFTSATTVVQLLQTGQSVLVHCSDGWDRTSQTVSLAQLMMDPFYRTIKGFIILIEKDWLSFGHQFARRTGHGANIRDPKDTQRAPIFQQFLDGVWQLVTLYPEHFEFTPLFLRHILYHLSSCLYGTFLMDSELERNSRNVNSLTVSLWKQILENVARFTNTTFHPKTSDQPLHLLDLTIFSLRIWSDFYGPHVTNNSASAQALTLALSSFSIAAGVSNMGSEKRRSQGGRTISVFNKSSTGHRPRRGTIGIFQSQKTASLVHDDYQNNPHLSSSATSPKFHERTNISHSHVQAASASSISQVDGRRKSPRRSRYDNPPMPQSHSAIHASLSDDSSMGQSSTHDEDIHLNDVTIPISSSPPPVRANTGSITSSSRIRAFFRAPHSHLRGESDKDKEREKKEKEILYQSKNGRSTSPRKGRWAQKDDDVRNSLIDYTFPNTNTKMNANTNANTNTNTVINLPLVIEDSPTPLVTNSPLHYEDCTHQTNKCSCSNSLEQDANVEVH
eukprot:TRINITY_DN5351_c0_g1_i1.p1 TRINITY_DN5351_c0_g1~~TRINITY_DN5351_c0_g1_i1.p1  ORF type:complete len:866 (+),score=134.28 TRINITY_DN5351_c0_g1_i1:95-2692(+)